MEINAPSINGAEIHVSKNVKFVLISHNRVNLIHVFTGQMPIVCYTDTLTENWKKISNPLNPKSDQHQISPCNSNALYNRVVMRIKDMITQDEFDWYFINFSPLLL